MQVASYHGGAAGTRASTEIRQAVGYDAHVMAERRPSPLDAALERVGDRWSLRIVDALLGGPLRFGELAAAIDGIAPNILAERLRRLVRAGILVARPYERRPVRYEYALTADGAELAAAVRALADWGARRSGVGEERRHAVCGTPLAVVAWCPSCREVVEAGAEGALEEVRL